jgi:hypothetical protein
MSAKIDGVPWAAAQLTPIYKPASADTPLPTVTVTGVDATLSPRTTFGFGLFVSTPGTYPITGTLVSMNQTAANISISTSNNTGMTWYAAGTIGSGSVTFTTLTATQASGTFVFTIPANSGGASGNKLVTDGVFNVTF